MRTPEEIKAEFYAYLDQKFGPHLTAQIIPPDEAEVGERVLYWLLDDGQAQRADVEATNLEIEDEMDDLIDQLGEEIDGLSYSIEPAISSGLPYARAIDIPKVGDLALGSLASDYARNHNELPEKGFPIRWLLGVIFSHSAKYLLYLDFTHPRLRALYVAEYDAEFEFLKGREIPQQLPAFLSRQEEMRAMVEAQPAVRWAKLVQVDGDLRTTAATNGHFVQE